MSKWYVFSEKGSYLRQRALYSDDCNRLQQTATDCNRKKAHLCVKEPCIPMTATDCNRLQQTATDCNRKKAHLCVKAPCRVKFVRPFSMLILQDLGGNDNAARLLLTHEQQ